MSVDALSNASKTASITQEGGKGILHENPMNLSQGGESIVGTSQDQKVKKRKNCARGKLVKKRKLKVEVHSLHTIGEDNEQIKREIDFMIQKLQLVQDENKQELNKQLNKTITAQENMLETLCQEPFVQSLMVEYNHLDVAAQCAVSSPNVDGDDKMPSEAKQSSDGITEVKHRGDTPRHAYGIKKSGYRGSNNTLAFV